MRAALLVVGLASFLIVVQGEDCSGHGTLNPDGKCVCEGAWPDAGNQGWTGPACEMPVFGAAADGADATQGCKDSGCGSLDPGNWTCFAVKAAWT